MATLMTFLPSGGFERPGAGLGSQAGRFQGPGPAKISEKMTRGARGGLFVRNVGFSASDRHRPRGPTTRHQSIVCCEVWLLMCRRVLGPFTLGGRHADASAPKEAHPPRAYCIHTLALNPKPGTLNPNPLYAGIRQAATFYPPPADETAVLCYQYTGGREKGFL